MKSFKDLKTKLDESGHDSEVRITGGKGAHRIVDGGKSTDATRPEVFETVRQYIANFTSKNYFKPAEAVVRMRAELNLVGIDFEYTNESGEGQYPITMNGGSSGWDMEEGDITSGDGVKEKLGHGVAMDIQFEQMENGYFKIHADLIDTE